MSKTKLFKKNVKELKFLNKIFKNQFVLYLVLIFALVNIVALLHNQDYTSMILFIILGIFTRYFTNNMTIILLVPLVVVNTLIVSHVYTKVKAYEGLENPSKKLENNDLKTNKSFKELQEQQAVLMESITNLAPVIKDATLSFIAEEDVPCPLAWSGSQLAPSVLVK